MHPYTVAKMVTSLALFYGRRLWLNMLAGGFKNDLLALDDTTPHDRRYDRTVEYTRIIMELCANPRGVTFQGEFYKTHNLKLTPPLPEDLQPGLMVSGSSPAGIAAARAVGAVAIKYPKPADQELLAAAAATADGPSGVRVGIICRADGDEAWRVAHERFPADRKGQLAHQLAMKTSDSSWHRQLSELGQVSASAGNPYWLHPFENYRTFCPYLVGSYEQVGAELSRYLTAGYQTFVLDIPADERELDHTFQAFQVATELQLQ
jgi:alkanesulfonate monooxygenase